MNRSYISNILKSLFATILLVGLSLQSATAQAEWESYGVEITASDAIDANDALVHFTEDGKKIKIQGTVSAVCEKVGCWAQFNTKDGQRIRIAFKDHSFFVPTESAGRQMVAEGIAYKDLNKEKPEDKPTYEFRLEATGVLLRN